MEKETKTYKNFEISLQNDEPSSMNQGLLRKRHASQNMIAKTPDDGSMNKPIRNLNGQRKGGRSASLTPTGGIFFERPDGHSFSGTFLQSHIMPAMNVSTNTGGIESSRIKSSHRVSPSRLFTNGTGDKGRKMRIRFLSADHVPRDDKEEPEVYTSQDSRKIKSKSKGEKINFQKSERAKIYLGSGPQKGVGRGNKVESPEIWLQKARQRKVAKGSKIIKKQASEPKPSHEGDGKAGGFESLDSVTYALSRTNFCDIGKNTRILKWLAEVNAQTYFDTVEQPS